MKKLNFLFTQFDVIYILPFFWGNYEISLTNLSLTVIISLFLGMFILYIYFNEQLISKNWKIVSESWFLFIYKIKKQIIYQGLICFSLVFYGIFITKYKFEFLFFFYFLNLSLVLLFYVYYKIFFLCLFIFFLFILLFFIKTIIYKDIINKYNDHFIYLNTFFLIFNFLNIIFNLLRFFFFDYYFYIKKNFIIINNYKLNFIIDNIIPIIAWQTCQALFIFFIIIYIKYYLYDIYIENIINKYINLNKDTMKYPDDYVNSYIYRYKNLYKFCFVTWKILIFIIGINAYFKIYTFMFNINMIFAFFMLFSMLGEFIFNVNNYYIVYKYFKK